MRRAARTPGTAVPKKRSTADALKRLVGACELSVYQTRSGIAALRDLCGERGWPPMLWAREVGYHFCASEAELEEWERERISERLTQLCRMIFGTLAPHLALFPKSRWANYLNTQITAVEAALEMAASQSR
ncbi:RacP protein [Streptomyces jumonjinensis]|uniref:RacP protein n=1 Tax=Streptomyces jumonjinensis TaxID=1945 RepID=A0A646KUW4_STRJU|nr:RacP protein [Streptomyces jumonjinensis]MQT04786.1 RacP protein [Streptomyces jumonjinensis]